MVTQLVVLVTELMITNNVTPREFVLTPILKLKIRFQLGLLPFCSPLWSVRQTTAPSAPIEELLLQKPRTGYVVKETVSLEASESVPHKAPERIVSVSLKDSVHGDSLRSTVNDLSWIELCIRNKSYVAQEAQGALGQYPSAREPTVVWLLVVSVVEWVWTSVGAIISLPYLI